jgi:hypothetical protein
MNHNISFYNNYIQLIGQRKLPEIEGICTGMMATKGPKSSSSLSSKQFAKRSVSSVTFKHKIKSSLLLVGSDIRLQSSDNQRNYLRRGSKTPRMLLISANKEMQLVEKELFPMYESTDNNVPSLVHERSDSFLCAASVAHTALTIAATVTYLSDSHLENLRTKRRSNSWIKDKVDVSCGESILLVSPFKQDSDDSPSQRSTKTPSEDGIDQRAVQPTPNSYQPRRLSSMSALKKHLEKTSISNTNVTCNVPLDGHL